MVNSSAVQEGWRFTIKNQTTMLSSFSGDSYVSAVEQAIQELRDNINSYEGTAQGVAQLKGFMAEQYHAGTFNINAALSGSKNRAFIEGSNQHASVDVSTNFGRNYSMKYYATGKDSALSQAKSVIDSYYEYLGKSKAENPLSFDEYLKRYEYSDDVNDLMRSVYQGQGRIIPTDQLEEAIEHLKRKMLTESTKEGANRVLNYERYLETLNNLSDRIKDGEGIESIPLSKAEAEALAELAKNGEFDPKDFGFELGELINTKYLLEQGLKAGVTSAVITLALQLVPEIYKVFDYLIKNGEVDKEQLKRTGKIALSASGNGFFRGSISAALTISCKAGKLGAGLQNVSPSIIGAVTVIVLDTMKNSCRVACGKMSFREMETRLVKDLLVSASSILGGSIAQVILPQLPVLGYMLGSFLGSVIGSFVISKSGNAVLSFCANTGFTLFGIVDQDYTLPQEVFDRLGIATVNFKSIEFKQPTFKSVEFKQVSYKTPQYETINYEWLRRGVIGVKKIGYV